MQLRLAILATALMLTIGATAHAQSTALFSQSMQPGGGEGGVGGPYVPPGSLYDNLQNNFTTSLASQRSSGTLTARTADDFVIPQGACSSGLFTITRLRVQMVQRDTNPQAFEVDLYADNGSGTAPASGINPIHTYAQTTQTPLGAFGAGTSAFEASFNTPGLELAANTRYWISGFGSDAAQNGAAFNNFFITSNGAAGTTANGVIIAPGAGIPDWTPVTAVLGPPALAFSFAVDGECLIQDADMSVTLAVSPNPVIAGTNLTYTAVASNNGPADAEDVSITLPLPAGTGFVSATPSAGGTCNAASPVLCTWAGITADGAQRSVVVIASVPASTANGTNLSATATVASATPDPDATNDTATAQTTVNTQANLGITLTDSPDPVTAGTNLTYTATITQGGPSDAQTVAFSLPLAAGTSFVSATPSAGGACVGAATVTCTWAGATAPGITRSASIVVLVAADLANGTVLSATATASSATNDPVPGNNAATTTTTVSSSANLEITLIASSATAALGEIVTFTATSTNLGPSAAQDVQIAMTLSPDFRYSSHAPSTGAVCTTPQIGQSGVISCAWAGATAPGAQRTLAVNAASNSPGTSSILAVTSSPTADPVSANNSASTAVLVGNPVEAIPSLGRGGLILLGLLLGLVGLVAVRARG